MGLLELLSILGPQRFFQERGFSMKRAFTDDLNATGHMYNWDDADSGQVESFMRRFWYFSK